MLQVELTVGRREVVNCQSPCCYHLLNSGKSSVVGGLDACRQRCEGRVVKRMATTWAGERTGKIALLS